MDALIECKVWICVCCLPSKSVFQRVERSTADLFARDDMRRQVVIDVPDVGSDRGAQEDSDDSRGSDGSHDSRGPQTRLRRGSNARAVVGSTGILTRPRLEFTTTTNIGSTAATPMSNSLTPIKREVKPRISEGVAAPSSAPPTTPNMYSARSFEDIGLDATTGLSLTPLPRRSGRSGEGKGQGAGTGTSTRFDARDGGIRGAEPDIGNQHEGLVVEDDDTILAQSANVSMYSVEDDDVAIYNVLSGDEFD
jgi:hypothetical protein